MRTRTMGYATAAAIAVSLGVFSALAQAVEIRWYGQAAFKLTSESGKIILIDPFISNNPKTPEELKDLTQLGRVDLILLTHAHGDHVGDTARIAELSGAKVAVNADFGHTLGTLGVIPYEQLIRFNKSGPIKPLGDGITVTMVRAEHSSEFLHADPTTGNKRIHPGGEPCGYVIEFENGFRVYHAGDTGVFADMHFIGAYYRPDLSLLPIGGHFTMDPAHAGYAVRELLKSRRVVPMHYGTFPPLKGTPEEFRHAVGDFSTEIIVMSPGETRRF